MNHFSGLDIFAKYAIAVAIQGVLGLTASVWAFALGMRPTELDVPFAIFITIMAATVLTGIAHSFLGRRGQ